MDPDQLAATMKTILQQVKVRSVVELCYVVSQC